MKKLISLFTAGITAAMCVMPSVSAGAAGYEHTIAAEAMCGIGGYSSDQSKTNIGFRVGGTASGVVDAYGDPAVSGGKNSKDVKVGFARFDLGDDTSNATKFELTLTGGTTMSGRNGNINLYAAVADADSAVVSGSAPAGENWTSFSWNGRPALETELTQGDPDIVVTPPSSAVIDVTELLQNKTGVVTLAVLGEPQSGAGDMTYSSASLTMTTDKYIETTAGIEIDFKDENALDGWSNVSGARFEADDTIGNYAVLDGAASASAPRTPEFETAAQMIIDFDMMLPSKKADGTTDNKIGGGNTGGIALMQGDKTAAVIGCRGDGQGQPSNILSTGGTSTDYVNGIVDGKATTYFDRWMHYTVLIDTINKTGDLFLTDPETGTVYRHEGRLDKYISNISSLTNIGVVSNEGYAAALANLSVKASAASSVVISSEDNTDTQYIPGSGSASTVQYFANAYYGITYNKNGEKVQTGETASLNNKSLSFSISNGSGEAVSENEISIDQKTGLLSIYPEAEAGDYTVTAACDGISESMTLHVKADAPAAAIQVYGEDELLTGGTAELKAIPLADTGAVLPEKEVTWSIDGEASGCSISSDGILTAGNMPGVIKVKAASTENGVSGTLNVYIRDSLDGQIKVEGVITNNGINAFSENDVIRGVALRSDGEYKNVSVSIKAFESSGVLSGEKTYTLDNISKGVQTLAFDTVMSLEKADKVRVKIFDESGKLISAKAEDILNGVYKNVPLVSDWITGAKSGLGMGAGILSPVGAARGVDPEITDLENSITYTSDENAPMPTSDNVLWYREGAYEKGAGIYDRDGDDWEREALPIGNGYMGGMLFGMPHKDQIQINEETFWAAGYRGTQTEVSPNYVNPNMSEGINGYMSVGNVFVDFYDIPRDAAINNYYRELNLDESVARVQYEYDGVKYNREYFASYPKEALVFRYTADDEMNFSVNPVSMHPGEITVNGGEITITGRLKDSEPYASGGNAAWNQESDLEYCTKIKVIADDGTVTDNINSVDIKGATGVTIIAAAATDYDANQFELNADGSVNMEKTPYKSERGVAAAIEKAQRRINGASSMTYNELKAEHIADYKSQFDTVHFSLTDADEICPVPTDELQRSYKNVIGTSKDESGKTVVSYDEDKYASLNKHLEELHYNYARYLMISSSRSTTMPANLQGKWCQSTAEIWGSCYCININMEMNYWFAGGAGLTDSAKSLIGWFNSQIPAGRVTAKNMYGVTPKSYSLTGDGEITFTDSGDDDDDVFIMHTKQAIMGTTDMTGSTSIQSAGNTAWLMYNLWDIYQTTGDKELLRDELYPIMRKAANFYTQYLYTNERKTTTDTEKYPDGYYYTTWAGRSPEQGPTQEGIKYDLQLVAGMYDYTIAAAEVLGVDEDKAAAWKEIRNHLETPVELGDDGQIKEWAQETSYNTDENGSALGDPLHRHISHLVGLYPGTLINRNTPEFLNGAKTVLENRGDDSTGWSCSNKFLLWARCLEGNKALELFRYQLAQKTYANLFDFHEPFQIDGNFGSAAAVMELLMQSQTGEIYILPALPDAWDKGEISGIRAKNGAKVDIVWSDNEAVSFTITPAADGDITIGYDRENGTFMLNNEIYADMREGKTYTIENAKAGTAYTFTAAEPEDDASITIADGKITAHNAEGGVLIIACYDENGGLINVDFAEGYTADLSDYPGCRAVKAFLWDSADNMKPLCEAVSHIM